MSSLWIECFSWSAFWLLDWGSLTDFHRYVLQRDRSAGNTQTPLHAIFPTLTIQLLLSFKKCSKSFCKMTIKTFEDFMYSISPFLPKFSFPHKISLSVTCNHSAYHTNLVCHFKIPFYLWYLLYLGLFLACFSPHRIHIIIYLSLSCIPVFVLACLSCLHWLGYQWHRKKITFSLIIAFLHSLNLSSRP